MAFGAIIIGDEILSGKREDKHLSQVVKALMQRSLQLKWCQIIGDDREQITEVLRHTLGSGDIVFSFGGIGATPDDHTRQCAAAAAGQALIRHPDAVAEIEARFGAEAYPNRILMAEFPEHSKIIPNPYNRVPGFSVGDIHFLPGFPVMAWPMMEWVLDNYYKKLQPETFSTEEAIIVHDAMESQLLDLMNDNVARFPQVKLFSLPSLKEEGRRIELGVRGDAAVVPLAMGHLKAGVDALKYRWTENIKIKGEQNG